MQNGMIKPLLELQAVIKMALNSSNDRNRPETSWNGVCGVHHDRPERIRQRSQSLAESEKDRCRLANVCARSISASLKMERNRRNYSAVCLARLVASNN